MNSDPKDENYNGQKHLIFDKTKTNLILHGLINDLYLLSSMDNIETVYHNFTTTRSSSIKKFSIEVLINKRNSRSNPYLKNNYESRDTKHSIRTLLTIK